MPSKSKLLEVFAAPVDEALRAKIAALPDPKHKYIIAFTPRSGSSYLCDVIKLSRALGQPGELLSAHFVPSIRRNAPSHTPDEYIDLIIRRLATQSVSGLKASWFQFNDFTKVMAHPEKFLDYKFIYLTRRDLVGQAISLYRATATDVFHTNIQHDKDKLRALERLRYDHDKVHYWYQHIDAQERGWQAYFAQYRIFPLCLTYEDINDDIRAVIARISSYLEVDKRPPITPDKSVFKKLGNSRSLRWAARYRLTHAEKSEAPPDTAAGPISP